MARVRTFKVDNEWVVPDSSMSKFITDCERNHYVNVTMLYVPFHKPDGTYDNRITVCVTKLDEKDPSVVERDEAEENEAAARA